MSTISINIMEETAADLLQALQQAETPTEEPPLTDLTEIEARLSALENRKIWRAKTGPNAEMIEVIPATMGSPYTHSVLYSIPLPDIKAGDVIEARCMFQVTLTEVDSTNTIRYMVGKWIMIGDTPTDTSGLRLAEPTALNVQRLRTHEPIPCFGDVVATQDMTGKFLNVVVYALRLITPPNHTAGPGTIRVDQNYGFLSVKVTPASMLS